MYGRDPLFSAGSHTRSQSLKAPAKRSLFDEDDEDDDDNIFR